MNIKLFDSMLLLCILITLAISSRLRHRSLWGIQANRFGVALCLSILSLSIIYNVINPSVSRVDRLYYHGYDQFYWTGKLISLDQKEKQVAITALTSILLSNKSVARTLIIQDLAANAADSELVISTLRAIANDQYEVPTVRNSASYYLNNILNN